MMCEGGRVQGAGAKGARAMLLLLAVAACWVPAAMACPLSCTCKWKGGKQTVECIDKSLITIPDGIDQGTQVLDFSGNNLEMLPRERFQRMGILNLQKIYLARCRIVTIDDRAFRGLTNLVELDFSDNLLKGIPSDTFTDYPSLMRLVLNGNPIKTLKAGSFIQLSFLTSLEISKCEIELIEDDAFAGLDHLEWLKIDGNRLKNIQGSKVLPEHLHGVNLQNNPWECDCRLMELRTWLINYKIPHSFEPKCVGPYRLKGQIIKTLDMNDLACLPDVTPTTLYLEIAEGKNVSLLCRVSAIPQATVSWWFQGRILQNDSMLAPGFHLYYYVEEGAEEKRSELFLFNTNTQDNGTFVCVAENPAGKSQSNYTVRIIVKEDPIVGIAAFPFEYVITISAAASVLALVIIIAIVVCIVRCSRQRRRSRKKERSKAVSHHSQQHGKSGDMGQIICVDAEPACPIKSNGSIIAERHHHEMILVATGGNAENMRAGLAVHPYASPPSLRNFQLEQNPDLINDTESVGKERHPSSHRVDGDGGEEGERVNSGTNSYQEAMENIIHDYDAGVKPLTEIRWEMDTNQKYALNMGTLPRECLVNREVYLTADVHLSPGRFLDADGYPIDYGLPKPPTHLPLNPPMRSDQANFYRTLPHRSRRDGASNPNSRLSREAEFLARSAHPPSYEHYSPSDVRYTVEGYPCGGPPNCLYSVESSGSFSEENFLPSPPAPYKGEPTVSPRRDIVANPWPGDRPYQVLQQQQHQHQHQQHQQQQGKGGGGSGDVEGARHCGDDHPASGRRPQNQPPSDAIISKVTSTAPNNPNLNQPLALTESPDEGYGGDTTEGTEI